ncbi:MAG: hypothetical protein IKU36_07050 [Bacteroidales bacterium]|nr:hypothetical protein [Bacteroidales bacterium]
MKTNKEYPATHSMATSWFAIDEDGKVAIMNYEDNGPVPIGTPEASPEEIIMTTFSTKVEGKPWRSLPLSKDEIQYLMENTEKYPDCLCDGEGFHYAVVRVCKDGMGAFIEAAEAFQSDDWGNTVCLDDEDGIFYLDWFAYDKNKKKVVRKIESLGVIEPLRKIFQSDDDDCKELSGLPFWGYRQLYSPWLPMEKLYAPRFTFKEDRLTPKLRELAHRIPVKFDDADKIQIAEHLPFATYHDSKVLINNRKYTPLHDASGREFYLAQDSIYCAGCGKECIVCYGDNDMNEWTYSLQRSKTPTVMVITDTRIIPDEYEKSSEFIFSNAVYIPLVEGIPHSGNWKSSDERDLADYPISKFFKRCKVNLECNIDFFRPRVILLYREVIPYLEEHYELGNNHISVLGNNYPFYIIEEVDAHIGEIIQYASMPYQGGDIQWRISGSDVDTEKF